MADSLITVFNGIRKRFRDMSDSSHAEVVSLPGSLSAAWAANTPYDARNYGAVEIQFDGSSSLSVTWSKDGVTYYPCRIFDQDGAPASSVSAGGIYTLRGRAWLKFTAAVLVDGSN